MMVPMLNVRKAPGRRGEGLVGRMRLTADATRRPVTPPSDLRVDQTGTVSRKFSRTAASRRQPVAAFPFMGGLTSTRFGN